MTPYQINIAAIIIGVLILIPGAYKLIKSTIIYYRYKYIMWRLGRAILKRKNDSKE